MMKVEQRLNLKLDFVIVVRFEKETLEILEMMTEGVELGLASPLLRTLHHPHFDPIGFEGFG